MANNIPFIRGVLPGEGGGASIFFDSQYSKDIIQIK